MTPRLVYLMTDSLAAGFLRGQAAFLRERGFDVTVIASPGEVLSGLERSDGVRTIAVPMAREMAPCRDLVSLVRLACILRRLRPDIINASTAKAALLGMLAASWFGIPVRIYTLRGLRLETTRGWKRRILTMTERITASRAHRILCVSVSVRGAYCGLFPRYAAKSRVLAGGSSNGIDPARFTPSSERRRRANELREQLGIASGAPVIGFVGRMVRDKGIVELVTAYDRILQAHPAARLLLLGDFEDGDALPPDCIRRLHQDERIIMPGFVAEMASYYAMMTVLAFPSYREGLPNVLLEAGAAEIPVVAFASTGVVDVIEDGVTGTLVPRGDESGLAVAILRYLDDEELRATHARAARQRVESCYRREVVWQAIENEYRELLARQGLATGRAIAADGNEVEAPCGAQVDR